MSPEDIKVAFDQAEEQSIAQLEALADIYSPGGLSYDQQELSDREFVSWFLDLTQRPHPEFSVMHFLPSVSPKLYESIATRYERIVAQGGE